MTFRTAQQIIKTNILSTSQEVKATNLTIKFGQFFFQKSFTKCDGEANSRHFYKNQN